MMNTVTSNDPPTDTGYCPRCHDWDLDKREDDSRMCYDCGYDDHEYHPYWAEWRAMRDDARRLYQAQDNTVRFYRQENE